LARVGVVTGGNRGIGLEISRQLASAGLHVILCSRDAEAGERAAADLAGSIEVRRLDVGDAASVRSFADGLTAIDVLVNNAGVALDGFDALIVERTLAVNTRGAIALTEALLPKFASGGRVVNLSSGLADRESLPSQLRERFADVTLDLAGVERIAEDFTTAVRNGSHRRLGWPSSAYRVSKLVLDAYTQELARRLDGDPRKLAVNSACPGWVRTRMGGSHAPSSVEEGADTPVFLALLGADAPTGQLFRDRAPATW